MEVMMVLKIYWKVGNKDLICTDFRFAFLVIRKAAVAGLHVIEPYLNLKANTYAFSTPMTSCSRSAALLS